MVHVDVCVPALLSLTQFNPHNHTMRHSYTHFTDEKLRLRKTRSCTLEVPEQNSLDANLQLLDSKTQVADHCLSLTTLHEPS